MKKIKQNLFKHHKSALASLCQWHCLDAPKIMNEKLKENVIIYTTREYLNKKIKMKESNEIQKIKYTFAKKCHIYQRKLEKKYTFLYKKEIRTLSKKISIIWSILLKIKKKTL